jgi:hypothetical protein
VSIPWSDLSRAGFPEPSPFRKVDKFESVNFEITGGIKVNIDAVNAGRERGLKVGEHGKASCSAGAAGFNETGKVGYVGDERDISGLVPNWHLDVACVHGICEDGLHFLVKYSAKDDAIHFIPTAENVIVRGGVRHIIQGDSGSGKIDVAVGRGIKYDFGCLKALSKGRGKTQNSKSTKCHGRSSNL